MYCLTDIKKTLMDAVILVHQLVDWQLQVDADIDILLTACSMSCNTYQLQKQMNSRRCNHNMSCICNCVLCMVIRALVQFVCKYCSSHQLMMMHVVYMVMVTYTVYMFVHQFIIWRRATAI